MRRDDTIVRRMRLPLLAILAIFVIGFAGYLLFDFGVGDAFAMTVLVLTTVGFLVNEPLTTGERIFSGLVAALGASAYLAILAVVAAALAEGEFRIASRRRRMDRRIEGLRDHYVICAYGRVGRAAARELEADGVPFVVVDRKEELEEQMRLDGVSYLIGDPTSEQVLRRAGIERAKGLLCAVDSDADNVYIALTGRALNPDIFIVARAAAPETPERLYRAGANRVISPYVASGRHMALLAQQPRIVDYLELAGASRTLRLEEVRIEPGSPFLGRPVAELAGGALALVLQRADGETVPNPSPDEPLRDGDTLVLLHETKPLG